MGDGSVAFAPQWLKTGHTTLRTGSAPSSKEEGSKGASWRESGSGSKLGLGAGADRGLTEPKSSGSQSRQQGNGSYSDRPSGSHRGDRGLGPRGIAQSRLLSDRELVEQTSALKIRPGRSGSGFGGGFKDTLTPRGTSKLISRQLNPTGLQRSNGRGQERELIGSSRHQNSSQNFSAASALLSPRQELSLASASLPVALSPGGSGQWTTKLADTPHEVPRSAPTLAQLANVSPHLPANGTNGLRASSPLGSGAFLPTSDGATPKSTTRMADAIANAQASAAQELEASKLESKRKEQLALRQSKQLVPVLPSSGKAKQTLGTLNSLGSTSSPGPTLMKKPSVSDGPKPGVSAFLSGKGDESANGLKRAHNSVGQRAPSTESSAGAAPPKPFLSRPSRDKDRLKFFSSLKSKGSSDTQTTSDASRQQSQDSAAFIKHNSTHSDPSVSANATRTENGQITSSGSAVDLNGTAQRDLTAEEEAFMRSLGWDGNLLDDDTEGGLTEEEIAAFYANQTRQNFTAPVCIPSKEQQRGTKNATDGNGDLSFKTSKQKLACSFHSEMEFSDSDVE